MSDTKTVSEVQLTYKNKLKISERTTVNSSQTCYEIFMQIYDADTIDLYETSKILLLNHANHLLGFMEISKGGASGTAIDIRLILQSALLLNASKIVLCHNHPSGDTMPSTEDIIATNRIKKACDLMDIQLLDHIIISASAEDYFSFSKEDLL